MEPTDIIARVQAAGDRLAHLSAAATPGNWDAVPVTYFESPEPSFWEIRARHQQCIAEPVVSHQYHEGGGIDVRANADYIVGIQPKIGARLAELLRDIAAQMRELQGNGINPASVASDRLVAVVDAINSYGT
jgi:hypothetical protein